MYNYKLELTPEQIQEMEDAFFDLKNRYVIEDIKGGYKTHMKVIFDIVEDDEKYGKLRLMLWHGSNNFHIDALELDDFNLRYDEEFIDDFYTDDGVAHISFDVPKGQWNLKTAITWTVNEKINKVFNRIIWEMDDVDSEDDYYW